MAEPAAEDRPPGRGALGGQPPPAPFARAARDRERDDHPVAAAELADLGAEVFDDAHELVAHRGAGLDERAAAAVVLVQVGAAHRARGDAHDDIGRVDDVGVGDVLGAHVTDTVERDGFHGAVLRRSVVLSRVS